MRAAKSHTAPKKEAKQYLTGMMIQMEQVVVAAHEVFIRAYAWLKLVTIWSVIRGEDSSWLDEASLSFSPGIGLRDNLTKSKTTGPGKKTKHREVFVSTEAYIAKKDWLEVGWKLWERAPRLRQNLIALPDPSLEMFRSVGAEVQDRIALTRNRLERLQIASLRPDYKELNNIAAKFWAEHSSRPSLPKWARALGTPEETTDRLGYWAVGAESAEVYIRNYRSLVGRAQGTVAAFMQAAYSTEIKDDGYPDLFGENDVIEELKVYLKGKIKNNGQAIEECPNLHWPWSRNTASMTTKILLKYGWTKADEDRTEPMASGRLVVQPEESSESEAEGKAPSPPDVAAWVVTKASRGKARGCLHVIGRCFRVPCIHYKCWTEAGEGSDKSLYTKVCKQCFPLGYPAVQDAHLEQIGAQVEAGIVCGSSPNPCCSHTNGSHMQKPFGTLST